MRLQDTKKIVWPWDVCSSCNNTGEYDVEMGTDVDGSIVYWKEPCDCGVNSEEEEIT
tara:strand:+ start:55 stop:225 length:171 start_codon:yes stop_codon:yes gene_type:complete